MIEENVIKKSLQNLYQLINQYYEKLKIKNKETGITQEMLDYDASIYRNIEYKLIPFTQIFDLNNDNPYILNYFETEVLKTLSLEEELQIESLFDNSSMKNAYAELILSQIVQEKDKRVVTNIREQIKREFPYMLDHEIEEAIENATQPFNIYNYSEDEIKNRYI